MHKVDFMNRLRGLSLRLRTQGFLTNLLQRTFTKFFNRHGLIVVKYGATLREVRFDFPRDNALGESRISADVV